MLADGYEIKRLLTGPEINSTLDELELIITQYNDTLN